MAALADGGKSKGAPARKSSRVAAKEGSKPREAKTSKPKEIKEKVNKTRVVSEKKKAPSRPEPSHPSYYEMVVEAISTLKERSGSSRVAIAKYVEEHYKNELPANFKKFLNNQLRNLSEKGQITQVKGSFKLTDELKKSSAVKAINKPSAETKPERSAVKAAAAPKPPKKLKVAKVSQASKAVKSSKVAKSAPKSPKPVEPAVKVADHEKPTPKAKPAVKAGRGRPPSGSKPAPSPAPPTPKPEKTAAVAKKGKPATSKPAPASKSKSTPAKGSSTPAKRKSPRVPPASSKTAASAPPAKRTRK